MSTLQPTTYENEQYLTCYVMQQSQRVGRCVITCKMVVHLSSELSQQNPNQHKEDVHHNLQERFINDGTVNYTGRIGPDVLCASSHHFHVRSVQRRPSAGNNWARDPYSRDGG
jgi:hypothetical protein